MNYLQRAEEAGVRGFMHCNELEKLVELAAGKTVLEIGSFMGLTAWAMAHTAKTITCVDTFKAATNGQRQCDELTTLEDFKRAVCRFDNVSYYVGTSEEAAQRIAGQVDIVLLDAMHTYEDVKADIERWWPHVLQGGIMAFHDYRHPDFPGVAQAVDEAFGPPDEERVCFGLRWVVKP